ncbi:MAG TPA: hypothetical protein EYN67_10935 [Flavobacteriales bacterium]|uniref:hypothetical protein n=1 Tax=Moritella sp. TaxID=78556 RepID=UPI001767B949|nr:hypothetical protein [Moritella sp.]MCJ8293461.1 hypothetical protein [Colwellia sp.]NQZ51540.1 hypothetical protein [Moritella sp.]NRA85826.1 hypothetical protein [Hyphomicrobiales bacterium]HHZ96045.1 hypothetical protein [Flavobacteriales bacterium]
MMISKEDLADWNSHPVTQAVFAEVAEQIKVIQGESVVRETMDLTAMQACTNEATVEGANLFKEAYEMLRDGDE